MRAERRVVTVLAADVVGSTALAERLGPEDARVILGETLARAVTVVETYGGTVKDLAGDGILALFGAPVAHDDDAERATRAALDIVADVVAGYPDPDYFLRVLLHSKSTSNTGGWYDERFDALIDQTMESPEGGASRLTLFHEADRLAVRDGCAVIPLTYRRGATLVRPGVEGWWQWGAPMQSLDGITVGDQRS